ncbi:hypothetical protein DSO57_1003805 [Entomophthora muscae]|uniref:Uncharacterized protein n=1 Tax=Entomophthora muscae TaxID=34485 RepID=A0ACC2UJ15_9FUNG|nr:hypothetical protein DSO57_1003805 [Entomophthora muscae]
MTQSRINPEGQFKPKLNYWNLLSKVKYEHPIFAVPTACLGIEGHLQTLAQVGPMPNDADDLYFEEPPQLTSSNVYTWSPLVSSRSTTAQAQYTTEN